MLEMEDLEVQQITEVAEQVEAPEVTVTMDLKEEREEVLKAMELMEGI